MYCRRIVIAYDIGVGTLLLWRANCVVEMLQLCKCVGLHAKKRIVNASGELRTWIDYSEEKRSVASMLQQGALGIIWRM